MINYSNILSFYVLFSKDDLKEAFHVLEGFNFYNVSSVFPKVEKMPSKEDFLAFYESFLEALFTNNPIDNEKLKKMFSMAISSSEAFFTKKECSNDRLLMKPNRPVIQMQPCGLFSSSIDHELHAKSYAKDALCFGIKFSIALTYEDAIKHKIYHLEFTDREYQAFNELRRLVRHKTYPLTVMIDQEKKVYPYRFSHEFKPKISDIDFFKNNSHLRVL
jgi:hypothetical protein